MRFFLFFLLLLILALNSLPLTPVAAFEVNGKKWASMPIPYHINPTDCPVLEDGTDIFMLVQMAMDSWSQVPCAEVSFRFEGTTTATWAADGQNTIYCVAENWGFGEGAAGATMWLPTQGEELEVEMALNAHNLQWRKGGGHGLETGVVDPLSVITHELGHWLGLGHSPDPFATMYYAMLPMGIQASLEGDDKWGICSLYPREGEECQHSSQCPEHRECLDFGGLGFCQDRHDAAGAFCSKHHLNCEDMCWVSFFECSQICMFTSQDFSQGYCAPMCQGEEEVCPQGFECSHKYAPAPPLCELLPIPPHEDVISQDDTWFNEDAYPWDSKQDAQGQDQGQDSEFSSDNSPEISSDISPLPSKGKKKAASCNTAGQQPKGCTGLLVLLLMAIALMVVRGTVEQMGGQKQ